MKRIIVCIMTAALLLSLAACSGAAKQDAPDGVYATGDISEDIGAPEIDVPNDAPGGEAVEDDPDYYMVATSYSKKEVEDFALKVRGVILERDWRALSEMMAYPVYVSGEEINNADEFVTYMDGRDVSDEFFAAVELESCRDMFANSHGIMFGSGEVWIAEYLESADEDKGTLYVIALNL